MFHIPNDKRAQKSADLIAQGLDKALQTKPYKDIKINDIYLNSYVSRATFYRLFDSIYDVLLYKCDIIVQEMLKGLKTKQFKNNKERGFYCVNLWLSHEILIKTIVENLMYKLLYDVIILHKEDLQSIYGIDYKNDPNVDYFVLILVTNIMTTLFIHYNEKGKKSFEEIFEITNTTMSNLIKTWQ